MIRSIKTAVLYILAFLLAGCVTAQANDSINFPSAKVKILSKQNIGDDDTKNIVGHLFKPKGSVPAPAVVLLHHCGGVTGLVTEDWPEYLTSLGYVVLTADSYGSRGVRRCTAENFREARANMIRDGTVRANWLEPGRGVP